MLFLGVFATVKSVGLFDISCSTQLNCLCQLGQDVSEDFLLWEFNNSALQNNENSLHVTLTTLATTCLEQVRTSCFLSFAVLLFLQFVQDVGIA